jgi:hypothetical protein
MGFAIVFVLKYKQYLHVFFTDDLVDDQYKKNFPSLKGNFLLVFDMCVSTVFLKTSLFFLVRTPSLSRNLFHTAVVIQRYPFVLLLCVRWFSIRGLRFDTSDRPYCWCCVIHHLSDSSSASYSLFIPTSPKSGRTPSARPCNYIAQDFHSLPVGPDPSPLVYSFHTLVMEVSTPVSPLVVIPSPVL